jgi:hypothetical protein
MLSTASVGSSATILNIDLNPEDGGAKTRVSWSFGGDIVSATGAEVYTASSSASLNEIRIQANGLLTTFWDGTINSYLDINSIAGGYISVLDTASPSQFAIRNIELKSTRISTWDWVHDPISGITSGTRQIIESKDEIVMKPFSSANLIFPPAPPEPLNYANGNFLQYTPSTDSYVLNVLFSEFNPGIYSHNYENTPFANGFSTLVNVIPEPSTYALFGLGGLALLIAYCRRKVA